MSNAVFPFKFLKRGFREYLAFDTAIDQLGGGLEVAQKLKPGGVLQVGGTLMFPNKGGTWKDFVEFWEGRAGAFDPFLYQRQDPGFGTSIDHPPVDTAGQEDFLADRRYVDVASVIVRVNDVVLTIGDDYTLKNEAGAAYVLGTSTALMVRFEDPPGLGAVVEIEYGFYHPVRFLGDELPDDQDIVTGGAVGEHLVDRTLAIRLRETGPGYSLREAPTPL